MRVHLVGWLAGGHFAHNHAKKLSETSLLWNDIKRGSRCAIRATHTKKASGPKAKTMSAIHQNADPTGSIRKLIMQLWAAPPSPAVMSTISHLGIAIDAGICASVPLRVWRCVMIFSTV